MKRTTKLGTPIDELARLVDRDSSILKGLGNCDSELFAPWLATVERIDEQLERLLGQISWVNLGGGYLFNAPEKLGTLARAVDLLRLKYGVKVFIEPGATFVRDAGYIIASVIDLFTSDRRAIPMLDTTVSHMPEVFEYRFEPAVLGHDEDSEFEYLLAGSTCLAGNVFGLYGFTQPLEIGSRVVFAAAGAYTTVKSHMFNGINLPTIYAWTESKELVLQKRFTYHDFLVKCGG